MMMMMEAGGLFGFVRRRRGQNRGNRTGVVAGRGYGTGTVHVARWGRRRPESSRR